jgi:TonB-linked SusC/RagA family outer membrane protein
MKTIVCLVKQRSGVKGVLLATFLFFAAICSNAQDLPKVNISGTVADASTNELIPGVNIIIKGTQTGSVTDINGKYSISAAKGSTLVYSYIGYENMEVQVGTQNTIDVQLKVLVQSLDGVVVIGYGSTTKKEVTSSIASVKSDEFNKGTYSSPIGLLQGKVAGLTIVKPNGSDPNAGYNIILRGTNTLTSGQGPLIIIDGVAGSDMKNVSPEEIESMDVLKDGAAAAIYGTRGSNGVIIITTKRAKAGAAKVEYTGQFSVQVAPRSVQNLSPDEFRSAIELYAPDKVGNIYDANTDWFKEITRNNPFSQKHNLAFWGGTDNFSHRTTIYIDNADGLLKDNVSNKYLLRTNISQKALNGILLIDYNVSYSMRNYKPANYDLFYQAFIRNPTSSVYDPENEYTGGYTYLQGIDYYNPVAMLNERTREGKTTDAGGNIRATLNLAKSLKWINFISIEQSDWEDMSYKTKYYPSILGKGGEAEINNGKSGKIQYESTANYTKTFTKHTIQALAGYSFQEQTSNTSYLVNSGFDSDLYGPDNIGAGSALGVGQAEMGSYVLIHSPL